MELRSGKTLREFSKKKRLLSNSLSAAVMKGEELRMPLPDELVERILAMVCFPQIFKARALSKSWRARLSSISSHDDEEKKLLAVSFQKRVCEWSDKWNTSCPVFVFDDFLIGYDCASQRWRKLPTLSVLPASEVVKVKTHLHDVRPHGRKFSASLTGTLLYIRTARNDITFVLNILTGGWKELPALPHIDERCCGTSERLVASKEKYQVITLYLEVGCGCAWISESKLGSWRSKRVELPDVRADFKLSRYDVYLNGVIYGMVHVPGHIWGFLAFDVKDETFTLLQMPPNSAVLHSDSRLRYLQMLGCNGTVYIMQPYSSRTIILFEADLVSRTWTKVTTRPPADFKFGSLWGDASSSGDCLIFEGHREILAYNVRKDEWTYFAQNRILQHCLRSLRYFTHETSFQPGMNLFLEA